MSCISFSLGLVARERGEDVFNELEPGSRKLTLDFCKRPRCKYLRNSSA